MSSRFWILPLYLFVPLPCTLVDATALSPPLSRRLLLLSNNTVASPPPSSTLLVSSDACSTISACNSRILPHSQTLTIAVVGIFVACVLMAFVSVYSRRFCIHEGNSRASYHSMERMNGEHKNEALVKSLPVVNYGLHNEEGKLMMKECAVCLSEFESGEILRLLPACDHLFHKDCIDMWLFSHTTCPLCRLSLLRPKKGSLVFDTSPSVYRQPMLPLDRTPPGAREE